MASVGEHYGLDEYAAQITALMQTRDQLVASMTDLSSQMASLQTLAANLNAGNYYTKTETDSRDNALRALIPDELQAPTYSPVITSFLASAGDNEARDAIGLGSAATSNVDAFETSGAVAAHNTSSTAHSGIIKSIEYVLSYTDSNSVTSTKTLTETPLPGSTWASHFPSSGAPSTAIGSTFQITFNLTTSKFRATASRSDYSPPSDGGGGSAP
jgi:hypothetical protein